MQELHLQCSYWLKSEGHRVVYTWTPSVSVNRLFSTSHISEAFLFWLHSRHSRFQLNSDCFFVCGTNRNVVSILMEDNLELFSFLNTFL